MLVKSDKSGTLEVPDNLSVDSVSVFRNSLKELLDKKPVAINLNCSNLDHVTSSHVNLLWQARMMCREYSVQLLLISVSGTLISVLKVLDLIEEFEIEKTSFSGSPSGKIDIRQIGDGELKLEFCIDSMSITANLAEFKKFLVEIAAPSKSMVELETVFYEVVTNIRLHSGLTAKDSVSFHALSDGRRITLEFIDSGVAFDPTTQDVAFEPVSAMKQGKRRGFGLIMIARMGGRMGYEYRGGYQNVLTVEKQWSNG